MQELEIKKLEDYLIAKNKSYAVWGLSKEEIKSEFFLSDEEINEYLSKRRVVFSIGEAIQLLIKINKKNESEKKNVHSATTI
mgnify:FL=1